MMKIESKIIFIGVGVALLLFFFSVGYEYGSSTYRSHFTDAMGLFNQMQDQANNCQRDYMEHLHEEIDQKLEIMKNESTRIQTKK